MNYDYDYFIISFAHDVSQKQYRIIFFSLPNLVLYLYIRNFFPSIFVILSNHFALFIWFHLRYSELYLESYQTSMTEKTLRLCLKLAVKCFWNIIFLLFNITDLLLSETASKRRWRIEKVRKIGKSTVQNWGIWDKCPNNTKSKRSYTKWNREKMRQAQNAGVSLKHMLRYHKSGGLENKWLQPILFFWLQAVVRSAFKRFAPKLAYHIVLMCAIQILKACKLFSTMTSHYLE